MNAVRPSRLQFGKLLLQAGPFLTAYCAASMLIDRLQPFATVPVLSDKWAYLRAHRQEVDVLFVGSSRVYRQIIPRRFDRVMAEGGHPLRSFNFGEDSMRPPESFYVLRQLCRLPMPKLKWVLIELWNIRADLLLLELNGRSAQITYWHDTYHTSLALRHAWSSPLAWSRKWPLLTGNSQLWGVQSAHLGGGVSAIQNHLWPRLTPSEGPPWLAQEGYAPLLKQSLSYRELEKFWGALDSYRASHPPLVPPTLLRQELEKIIQLVRATGAEPIFILSPTLTASENLQPLPDGAPLFAFNEPEQYPLLYSPAHFCDIAHLNQPGAEIYSETLARRLLDLLATHATKPAP